jgi:diguanylate cyclase (GGDEF)-like protein
VTQTPPPAIDYAALAAALDKVISSLGRDRKALGKELANLERRHGAAIYAEALYLLSNLRFPAEEARTHWTRIVAHRTELEEKLARPVDLLVALVSYFVDVQQNFENPVLVELKLLQQTQASAYRDELTGLYNFRYFREYLDHEIARSERYKPPLSLVMVDLDNFKTYNDQYGHEAGNDVLSGVAALLKDSLRRVDVAARYGGEEFVLVLPATSKSSAFRVAERARRKVEEACFSVPGRALRGKVTVSIGVATFPGDASEAADLIRKADSAMYTAKAHGKNCVRLFGHERRGYRRVNTSLHGRFCVLAAEYHQMTTLDISEGGLRVRVDRALVLGTVMDMVLSIPGEPNDIQVSGRVVRVEEAPGGKYEAAVRFVELSPGGQASLGRYLRGMVEGEQSDAEAEAAASTRASRGTASSDASGMPAAAEPAPR